MGTPVLFRRGNKIVMRGRGMEGRQLPFHHTVSLPLFLFVLALLACLQLALGLAALILGGQGPCGNRKAELPTGL